MTDDRAGAEFAVTDERSFDGVDYDTLSIGRRSSGGIEFATRDSGNSSSAVISPNDIWDVIDHLIELAGPRAFAGLSGDEPSALQATLGIAEINDRLGTKP